MIRFALACEQGHAFESWFPSGASYDAQLARGLVTCPVCHSAKIEKQIMAPAIASKRRSAEKADPAPPAPVAEAPVAEASAQPVVLLSEREQAIRAMLRAVRDHVTKTSDYVGPGFAAEARRMHHGEIEQRSIYGEASAQDAKALLEEGIEIHALPPMPDDRN